MPAGGPRLSCRLGFDWEWDRQEGREMEQLGHGFLMHHRLAAALTRTSSVAHSLPHRHAAIDVSDGNNYSHLKRLCGDHLSEASAPSPATMISPLIVKGLKFPFFYF